MNTLKDYVNFRLTHADKIAEAEGYPLTLENCKKHKKMKQLEVYGNSVQDGAPTPEVPIDVQSVGELVTDETDVNYGKYKIPVITHGKNLYSPYDIYTRTSYEKVIEDGRECIRFKTGLASYFTGRGFKENTQYTVSFYCKTVPTDGEITVPNYDVPFAFTHTDGSYAHKGVRWDAGWTKVTITSAAGKTVKYIGCYSYEYRLWNYIDVNSFQFEEGANTETEYEPYVEPVTTNIFLNEPLCRIDSYADYIDFKNGKVVRNIFKQILKPTSVNPNTPTLAWNKEGHCAFQFSNYLPVRGVQGYTFYSNAFKRGNWTWAGNTFPGNYIYFAQNEVNIHGIVQNTYLNGITDDSTDSEKKEALKNFFDNNDVYVIARRKTPIEEPITLDLPKLTAKTTIIEVNTSLAPSDVYGKYIKR